MTNKHTPGPWHCVCTDEERDVYSIMPDSLLRAGKQPDMSGFGFEFGTGYAVAFVDGWVNDQANACLIASVPDLLSSLIGAANYIDALGGDSKSYRAVIAKARGE